MSDDRFFILKDEDDPADKDCWCIRDRTFKISDIYGHYEYDDLEEICKELNSLNNFKNKFKRLSTDAHNYLRCYERAFEELYDKYDVGSDEHKVLDELDELYCKYEKEVG